MKLEHTARKNLISKPRIDGQTYQDGSLDITIRLESPSTWRVSDFERMVKEIEDIVEKYDYL